MKIDAAADAVGDETETHRADEHAGEGAEDEESDARRGEKLGGLATNRPLLTRPGAIYAVMNRS